MSADTSMPPTPTTPAADTPIGDGRLQPGDRVKVIECADARRLGLVLGARYDVASVKDGPEQLLELVLADTALDARKIHRDIPAAVVTLPGSIGRIHTEEDLLPEAFASEDGDTWWIHGHVTAEAAVLAVLLEQALNVDPEQAIDTVFGFQTGRATDGYRATELNYRLVASRLLAGVNQVWLAEDPTNEERAHLCAPWFPGAMPYTVVHG